MAVSGTITFVTNCNELIKGSLRLISGYDFENSTGPSATQLSLGREALNIILKQMGARGLQLWERKYAVIFPQYNQSVFKLGSPGPSGDHACLTTPLDVAGFVQTTLSTDAASGATSIVVEETSSNDTVGVPAVSITDNYYIGIQLNDGTLQWTQVNGTPGSTTVTIDDALTDDADEGNWVYCYQTKLFRPLMLSAAFVRQVGGNDTPIQIIPRDLYNSLGQKAQTNSTPSQLYYDNQRDTGYVYIYPGFSTVQQQLYIEIQKPIDDMTDGTTDFDLPQEWFGVLKYGLALALAPEYEVPMTKFKQITALYQDAETLVDGWDQEQDSLYIQPNATVMFQGGNWR